VRFNKSLVRQAGSVAQDYLSLELVRGQRHASCALSIAGTADDRDQADEAMKGLRASLGQLPDDPYLLYSLEVRSTEQAGKSELPEAAAVLDAVLAAGKGRTLWASTRRARSTRDSPIRSASGTGSRPTVSNSTGASTSRRTRR